MADVKLAPLTKKRKDVLKAIKSKSNAIDENLIKIYDTTKKTVLSTKSEKDFTSFASALKVSFGKKDAVVRVAGNNWKATKPSEFVDQHISLDALYDDYGGKGFQHIPRLIEAEGNAKTIQEHLSYIAGLQHINSKNEKTAMKTLQAFGFVDATKEIYKDIYARETLAHFSVSQLVAREIVELGLYSGLYTQADRDNKKKRSEVEEKVAARYRQIRQTVRTNKKITKADLTKVVDSWAALQQTYRSLTEVIQTQTKAQQLRPLKERLYWNTTLDIVKTEIREHERYFRSQTGETIRQYIDREESTYSGGGKRKGTSKGKAPTKGRVTSSSNRNTQNNNQVVKIVNSYLKEDKKERREDHRELQKAIKELTKTVEKGYRDINRRIDTIERDSKRTLDSANNYTDKQLRKYLDALAQETKARKDADSTLEKALYAALEAERKARREAMADYEKMLREETKARRDADAALGKRLDGYESRLEDAEDAVEKALRASAAAVTTSTETRTYVDGELKKITDTLSGMSEELKKRPTYDDVKNLIDEKLKGYKPPTPDPPAPKPDPKGGDEGGHDGGEGGKGGHGGGEGTKGSSGGWKSKLGYFGAALGGAIVGGAAVGLAAYLAWKNNDVTYVTNAPQDFELYKSLLTDHLTNHTAAPTTPPTPAVDLTPVTDRLDALLNKTTDFTYSPELELPNLTSIGNNSALSIQLGINGSSAAGMANAAGGAYAAPAPVAPSVPGASIVDTYITGMTWHNAGTVTGTISQQAPQQYVCTPLDAAMGR